VSTGSHEQCDRRDENHRNLGAIDPAILWAGQLGRLIEVPLPGQTETS